MTFFSLYQCVSSHIKQHLYIKSSVIIWTDTMPISTSFPAPVKNGIDRLLTALVKSSRLSTCTWLTASFLKPQQLHQQAPDTS